MTSCTVGGHNRAKACDTCDNPTCLSCAVNLSLGSGTPTLYTECPTCALERGEDEEHGPKTLSIKPLIYNREPRMSPGFNSLVTTWLDGAGYRVRYWGKGGAS